MSGVPSDLNGAANGENGTPGKSDILSQLPESRIEPTPIRRVDRMTSTRLLQAATAAGSQNPNTAASAQCPPAAVPPANFLL